MLKGRKHLAAFRGQPQPARTCARGEGCPGRGRENRVLALCHSDSLTSICVCDLHSTDLLLGDGWPFWMNRQSSVPLLGDSSCCNFRYLEASEKPLHRAFFHQPLENTAGSPCTEQLQPGFQPLRSMAVTTTNTAQHNNSDNGVSISTRGSCYPRWSCTIEINPEATNSILGTMDPRGCWHRRPPSLAVPHEMRADMPRGVDRMQ